MVSFVRLKKGAARMPPGIPRDPQGHVVAHVFHPVVRENMDTTHDAIMVKQLCFKSQVCIPLVITDSYGKLIDVIR